MPKQYNHLSVVQREHLANTYQRLKNDLIQQHVAENLAIGWSPELIDRRFQRNLPFRLAAIMGRAGARIFLSCGPGGHRQHRSLSLCQ